MGKGTGFPTPLGQTSLTPRQEGDPQGLLNLPPHLGNARSLERGRQARQGWRHPTASVSPLTATLLWPPKGSRPQHCRPVTGTHQALSNPFPSPAALQCHPNTLMPVCSFPLNSQASLHPPTGLTTESGSYKTGSGTQVSRARGEYRQTGAGPRFRGQGETGGRIRADDQGTSPAWAAAGSGSPMAVKALRDLHHCTTQRKKY